MDILKDLFIINDEYYNEIICEINNYGKNVKCEDLIKLNVKGLSLKEFSINIPFKDLYKPINEFIFLIINKDIELNFNNNKSIKFNYFKSFQIMINDDKEKTLSINHILMKHNFNIFSDKIILKYNNFSNTNNFNKSNFTAICPILMEKIINPYICDKCNNCFQFTKKIKKIKNCPLCRCDCFNKNMNKKLFKNNQINTINLYFYDYLTKSEIIIIIYNLELWMYDIYEENITKETLNNIWNEINFKYEDFNLKDLIEIVKFKLNNINIINL